MKKNEILQNNQNLENPLAFIFSGIACQWKTMAQELLRNEPIFHQKIEQCDTVFKQYSHWSILEELGKDVANSRLDDPAIAHPCIFSIETALVELLNNWGIKPTAILGHSAGEVAAAHAAGILNLENSFKIVWKHCLFLNQVVTNGSLAHISLPVEKIKNELNEFRDAVVIAAENSPNATLISGEKNSIKKLVEIFKDQEVFCRILNTNIPFHNPAIEPYLDDFFETIKDIDIRPAEIPIYSYYEDEATTKNDFDAVYWPHNLRDPIMFRYSVEKMIADGYRNFIEISPHNVLTNLIEETLQNAGVQIYFVIPTLKRLEPEKKQLLKSLVTLNNAGYQFSLDLLSNDDQKYISGSLDVVEQDQCKSDLYKFILSSDSKKIRDHFIELIKSGIKEVSDGAISPSADLNRGFFDIGIDSISAITLKNYLSNKLDISLTNTLIFDYPDINRLSEFLEMEVVSLNQRTESDNEKITDKDREAKNDLHEPIAIVGMACRFPGGANDPQSFWDLLINNRDVVSDVPKDRWNMEEYFDPDRENPGKSYSDRASFLKGVDLKTFDASFFKMSPKEVNAFDPQQRLLLEVTWEALESAGINPLSIQNKRVGFYLGISSEDYKGAHLWSDDLKNINAYSATGTAYCCAGGRVSFALGINGPNISIDTACSSSLTALQLAVQALRTGECEMAFVAGVNCMLTPNLFVFFSKVQALAPDGRSKAFDAAADGFGRGEGCGVIILQRVDDARSQNNNILALVRGAAINQDGASSSFSAPNGLAQQEVLKAALQDAQLSPADVDYLDAHGTGTKLGDPVEMGAIQQVYGKSHDRSNPFIVGSVKTNIGHLEAGAGVASIIKTVLMMQNKQIPASLHFEEPNPLIDWEQIPVKIPTKLESWTKSEKPRIAAVSAFGFSGTNAHVIIEEAPFQKHDKIEQEQNRITEPVLQTQILNISAQSEPALKEYIQKYIDYLSEKSAPPLSPICYTANVCRQFFDQRISVIGKSKSEISNRLKKYIDGKPGNIESDLESQNGLTDLRFLRNKKIVFLFTGQGSQYVGMGHELYETNEIFRNAFQNCSDLFEGLIDRNLIELIYVKDTNPKLVNQTNYTQPLIFSIQIALIELWKSWGITPDAVVGHSIGEFAAAVCAGVFDLKDAVKLVAARGNLMHSAPGDGVMAAIFTDDKTLEPLLEPHAKLVSIATINSANNVVISGEKTAVAKILSKCTEFGLHSRSLAVSHAFHSPLMEVIIPEFENIAKKINYHKPNITFISCVDGKKALPERISKSTYWSNHIRNSVRFYDAVKTLELSDFDIFLEIGATPILTPLTKQIIEKDNCLYLSSLRRGKSDWQILLTSVSNLFVQGVDFDWHGFYSGASYQKVKLPTYPFQRKKYWIDPVMPVEHGDTSVKGDIFTEIHELLGTKMSAPSDEVRFVNTIEPAQATYFKSDIIPDHFLFPEAAFLEMGIAAGREFFKEYCLFENIEFLQPLTFHKKNNQDLQSIATPLENQDYQLEIFSLNKTDSESQWTKNVSMKIMPGEEIESQRFEPEEIVANCQKEISGSDLKHFLNSRSEYCKKDFESIISVWQTPNTSLLEIVARKDFSETKNNYSLYLPLLECILQTAKIIRINDKVKEPLNDDIIVVIENIKKAQFYKNDFEKLFGLIEFDDDPDLIKNISIQNEKNEPVIRLSEVRIGRTEISNLIKFDPSQFVDFFYKTEWIEKELQILDSQMGISSDANVVAEKDTSEINGKWLIFHDHQTLKNDIQSYLEQKNFEVINITQGDSFGFEENEFKINPTLTIDFEQLFNEIGSDRIEGLIYLWSMLENIPDQQKSEVEFQNDDLDLSSLKILQQKSIGGALNLIQQLHNLKITPKLFWITSGMQSVVPSDRTISIEHSPLLGFLNTVDLEFPEFKNIRIDLSAEVTAAESDLLMQEFNNSDDESRIGIRGEIRYAARIKKGETTQDKKRIEERLFKPDKTYLITGGLGELGMLVTEWMIKNGAHYISITGRSDLTEDKRSKLDALSNEHNQIIYFQKDVSNAEAVSTLFGEIKEKMPELKGIFHAAGALDESTIDIQNWEQFENVFAPKVWGGWNLHLASLKVNLDHFIMFSSIASEFGNLGHSNYAAANYFLNSLAEYRQKHGFSATSIAWGPWQDIGMAAREDREGRLAKIGIKGLKSKSGLKMLKTAILNNDPSCSIIDIDWSIFLNSIPENQTRGFYSIVAEEDSRTQSSTASNDKTTTILLELQSIPAEERIDKLEYYLQTLVAGVLGYDDPDQISIETPLMAQGIDSLMTVELRNLIGKNFEISLPVSFLFNYPSIQEIAKYLIEKIISAEQIEEEIPFESENEKDDFADLDNLSEAELEELINKEIEDLPED